MVPLATKISSTVTIRAGPSDVWAVLCDLGGYHEWHPHAREAKGTIDDAGYDLSPSLSIWAARSRSAWVMAPAEWVESQSVTLFQRMSMSG